MRRLVAALAVVVAVAAGCTSNGSDGTFVLDGRGDANGFAYSSDDRKPITELAGPEVGGTDTLSTNQFKGQVVVLNFWGSWCGDCRVEAADLQRAYTALKPKGVQFLGINVKDGEDAAVGYEQAKQITYPSIFDPGMRTLLALRGVPANAIPATFVLDRSSRVAHVWLGRVTESQVTGVVSTVAAEH